MLPVDWEELMIAVFVAFLAGPFSEGCWLGSCSPSVRHEVPLGGDADYHCVRNFLRMVDGQDLLAMVGNLS